MTTDANDVSLTKEMNEFANVGIEMRAACGKMIRKKICESVIPSAAPASRCVSGIDEMAARIASEAYAAVFNDKTQIAAAHPEGDSQLIPSLGNP